MPRVLVLNNYSFQDVWGEVSCKEKPDHHLYGINYFARRGYEVEIIPFQKSALLQSLNQLIYKSRFPIPLGDLDQQWSTLAALKRADIIYAPCQTQTHLLAYLHALGVVDVPVVVLAHHPLNRGMLTKMRAPFIQLLVRGVDAFPSLSKAVSEMINQVTSQPFKSQPILWGPDATYYPQSSSLGASIVAAGRTGRDFLTFGLAATQTNTPAHIICLESAVLQGFQAFGKNVQLTIQPDASPMMYPELIEIYVNARAIAIPMYSGNSLCGLTSLMDALALGKPVIMTRNPYIDLDIEKEGIGLWVEPGDLEGWKAALYLFEENPDKALKMGIRARRLVEEGMNSKTFADQVMDIFEKILS